MGVDGGNVTAMSRRLVRPSAGLAALALVLIGCSNAPRYDLGDTPIPTTVPATTSTLPDVTEVLEASIVLTAEAAVPEGSVVHVVEAGDLLYDLALEYGTDLDALLDANPGLDPTAVAIGTEVVVPLGG